LLIAAIVFAESGLLIGFFLPGDTLLLSAGVLAAQGKLPHIAIVILVIIFASLLGDNAGYSIGRRMGRRLFRKKDSMFFHQENLQRAEKFYEKHGGKTILFAKFIPIVRTFAPMVAGISKMPWKKFIIYDICGAIFWGAGVTLAGYFVGSRIPDMDKYILPAILCVMFLTFGPTLYHLFGNKENRQMLTERFKIGFKTLFNKKTD
jgi:membrane-associated protein